MLDHALMYAERGWPAFALTSRKKPLANCPFCDAEHKTPEARAACSCLTCHGFYAATTDPARITEMFEQYPNRMLAIRTGTVSGLAVVDVDIKAWVNGAPARNDPGFMTMSELGRQGLLPATLTQRTGGGGWHFFYAHPGGYLVSSSGRYGPGVDSKADGGYVVVAPSRSHKGPYRWASGCPTDQPLTPLPDELAMMARRPDRTPRRGPIVSSARRAEAGAGAARPRLRGLLQVVVRAAPGERNDFLFWASARAGEMVRAGEVPLPVVVAALQSAATAVGLPVDEAGDEWRGTIGSGLRTGLWGRSVGGV